MRVLVLGGSVFLSRAVAAEAVRRGHEVVCASRGATGSVPRGCTLVPWDRTDGAPPPAALAEEAFDAVVDVARHPSWVRTAVAAWPAAHVTFVSTVNVYADDATPGQTPATGPLVESLAEDVALEGPDAVEGAYGRMKVACEQVVVDRAAAAFVVRPGLIVGPGDPTGRFTYWPERLADAGPTGHPEVLAPGSPSDVVQVIDVRDLATWIVTAFETSRTGTYDGVGVPQPLAELLGSLVAALAPAARLTWVSSDLLAAHDVQPWSGPSSVPLWLPRPAYDGIVAHDVAPSLAAGLTLRPLAETAVDVVAWLGDTPDAVRTGLSREAEAHILNAAVLAQGAAPPDTADGAW